MRGGLVGEQGTIHEHVSPSRHPLESDADARPGDVFGGPMNRCCEKHSDKVFAT